MFCLYWPWTIKNLYNSINQFIIISESRLLFDISLMSCHVLTYGFSHSAPFWTCYPFPFLRFSLNDSCRFLISDVCHFQKFNDNSFLTEPANEWSFACFRWVDCYGMGLGWSEWWTRLKVRARDPVLLLTERFSGTVFFFLYYLKKNRGPTSNFFWGFPWRFLCSFLSPFCSYAFSCLCFCYCTLRIAFPFLLILVFRSFLWIYFCLFLRRLFIHSVCDFISFPDVVLTI